MTNQLPKPLTSKQKRFLEIYHLTGKAGESWTRAGYTASEKTARSAASRFLKRDDARTYLHQLQQHDCKQVTLTREKMLDRLEQIIDSPDARDRDVIYAIKEANRMLGTYNKPEPPPREEPANPLLEYIAAVRRGESPDFHIEIPGHAASSGDSNPHPSPPPQENKAYQPTEAERRAILNRPEPAPETPHPVRRPETREERDARQDAQLAATRGRPNIPPSKSRPTHVKSNTAATTGFYARLNRRRRAGRKKQAAG